MRPARRRELLPRLCQFLLHDALDARAGAENIEIIRDLGGTIRGIGDPTQYPARLNAMGYRPVLLLRANPVQQAGGYTP